ncbi:hypothetical protein [Flammeovirga sp. SJP92]|uniref:hypothetical protein n=1 Tax=Flammeovirga sp. SJP92 TaxID=1775430 RepID=UPI000786AF92|nr:hypothetical protein [Flammeovirga sp. SJP92]KXX70861.1 hypothetical protein AVL50_11445 [Flammeovirga sp. SJP92]
MNKTLLLNRNFINFGIPAVLMGILILLMNSPFYNGNDTLSLAISADLLITIPLVYFLLIRKSQIPKTTVVPMMVIGLLIGTYFLPKENQLYLTLFKNWVLPLIELSIITIVIIKVRKATKTYQKLKNISPDFYDTLKNVCAEILPQKLVLPFATEVAVLYYGFIHWKKRELGPNEFTYHKKSGTPALLGALILIIAIETIAFHFLLAQWNTTVAWVLTLLSLYTGFQFMGFAKALSQRPISIEDQTLTLRYSIMNETQLPFSTIKSITLSKKGLPKNKLNRSLSPLGDLESHNVIIHLKEENTLTGLYGIKKKFKTISFHIDNADEFVKKTESNLP